MSSYFPNKAYQRSKGTFESKRANAKGNEYGFIAMNLFGNRFFSDETSMELLSELLLVLSSPKKIKINGDEELNLDEMFPSTDAIPTLKENEIQYKPNARINLKLFSIMPNSGKVVPDKTHKEQYEKIKEILESKIDVSNQQYITDKEDISFILSNLYMGFQGIGGDRDWSAQSFIPITSKLLSMESIWKKTKAKRAGITEFNDVNGAIRYFEHTGHIFYCRGGEVLYLQIISALSRNKDEIEKWLKQSGMDDISIISTDPEEMRRQLIQGFSFFLNKQCPQMIGDLADYIDSLDPINTVVSDSFMNMGWIDDDTWSDGFLFIQDLLHIFKNESDLIETFKMLEMACTMHLLRTMVNSVKRFYFSTNTKCPFSTAVIVSPQEEDLLTKNISHYSLKEIQLGIREAIGFMARQLGLNITDKDLATVHANYGDKLFIKNCKRLGLVIPYKGGNEHFVLNKALLSYLVTSGNTPESRVSLDTFLRQVKERYGFVFTFDEIENFNSYFGKKNKIIKEQPEGWVSKMLEESGCLIKLSDAYSLVVNNYKERIFK